MGDACLGYTQKHLRGLLDRGWRLEVTCFKAEKSERSDGIEFRVSCVEVDGQARLPLVHSRDLKPRIFRTLHGLTQLARRLELPSADVPLRSGETRVWSKDAFDA